MWADGITLVGFKGETLNFLSQIHIDPSSLCYQIQTGSVHSSCQCLGMLSDPWPLPTY